MRCFTQYRIVAFVAVLLWSSSGSLSFATDAHYMMVFSFQGRPNLARSAHTFAAFVRVAQQDDEFNQRSELEVHSISWLPATLNVMPMRPRPEIGVNLDLYSTLNWGMAHNRQMTAWGPYRIREDLFRRAVAQSDRLNRGGVGYIAMDRRYRPRIATNCFHAIADMVDGPMLNTGMAYGAPASQMVVNHLSPWIVDRRANHHWLINELGLASYPLSLRR